MTETQPVNARWKRWVRRAPGVLAAAAAVLGVLIAAAWVKGWPMLWPRPATQTDSDHVAWCAEHGVPESLCTRCRPELERQLPMCSEHGLPEALCTLCDPELRKQFVVCEAHGLPPAFCQACRADQAGKRETDAAGPSAGGSSPPGPAGTAASQGAELPLVRLFSSQTMEDAGIEVAPVDRRPLVRRVACLGVVEYQRNRFAPVRPRVEGVVREVLVDVGASVREGDVIAVVDSAVLGEAKAEHLSAQALLDLTRKNAERLEQLANHQIVPGKKLLEAETRLAEATINAARALRRLENLGLSPAEIERVTAEQDTSPLLPLAAPLSGVVVRRNVAAGEAVQPSSELFAVADLSVMWVQLQLHEEKAEGVREGQRVTFTPSSGSRRAYQGRVLWVSPEVDRETRTVQVRAEVENTDGRLRAGAYGTGWIEIAPPAPAAAVPREAVQWHEGAPVVFVLKEAAVFEPRRVALGIKAGAMREVTAGVKPGELVATTGAFLLKTELQKGAIGAGCCGD